MKKKAEKQPYLYLRLIEMLLGILITAIGLSCMMKSQLGQTAITAFTQNLTAITGVFAIGDVRDKPLRQIVTAVSDGAVASKFVDEFLAGLPQ